MSIASSPSLAEALAKVHFEDFERDDATGPERMHIAYAIAGLVGQIFFAFEHWKEGILTDEQFAELYSPSNALLSRPYLASVWPQLRPGYPKDSTNGSSSGLMATVNSTASTTNPGRSRNRQETIQRKPSGFAVYLLPDPVSAWQHQYGDDSTVVSSPEDYCRQYGLHIRTVQRWGK